MSIGSIYKSSTLPTKHLFLDTHNPRFSNSTELNKWSPFDAHAQELTRRRLMRNHGARNLMESIIQLGFLTVDRIVVKKVEPEKYLVIEGNRRLAAVKTLIREARIGMLSLKPEVLATLREIEVLVLDVDENEVDCTALLIQGVRHISGVRSWGPYQQGKLVHSLISGGGMTYREASQSVGLSPSRVSTLLHGYYSLKQMMSDPDYGKMCSTDMFSYFEHAYLKIPVREWLGWDAEEKKYLNEKTLKFFYSLITPSIKGQPPKLLARDVRDLLPEVLTHNESHIAFCDDGATIAEAYALARPHEDILDPFLKSVSGFLRKVQDADLKVNSKDMKLLEELHLFTSRLLAEQAQ